MLAAAAACVAAFWLLLVLAYSVGPAQWLDNAALDGFVAAVGSHWQGADAIAHAFDPAPYALMVLCVLGYAVLRRDLRHTAAAFLLLAGANVSSQVLKPLLAHPRSVEGWSDIHPLHAAAFPSGHTTASMSLALAAVLVAPRVYRPVVAAVGGFVVLAVSISLMAANWHWPSDVVGGQLLATTWCLIALAALRSAEQRWPVRGSMREAARQAVVAPSRRALIGGLLAAAALVAIAVLARAAAVAHFVQAHTSSVAVGAAVSASAIALLAGVTTLAVRR